MSTLVAYDSSSEDDEPVPKENLPLSQSELSVSKPSAQGKSTARAVINDAPMVGPSVPPEDSQGYVYCEEEIVMEPDMPRSPPSTPDASVAARIRHFLDLKAKGVHFNEDLARKSAFKNPALLQTLMDRAGIEATGYKEALLKSQQSIRAKDDAEKKTLAAAGKRSVEFTSGGLSAASSATSSPGGLQKRRRQ